MHSKRAAIYLRCSTAEQSVSVQERELRMLAGRRGWKIFKVYKDEAISGATSSRPALNEMIADCHQRKFDVLLLQRLDRLGRNLRNLVTLLDDLRAMGVDFVSLNEALDTSTSA